MIGVLDTVVRCLSGGEIIGYPTEGVWGLGCDPSNQLAVTRLLKLKNVDYVAILSLNRYITLEMYL